MTGVRAEHLEKLLSFPFTGNASPAQVQIDNTTMADIRALQDGAVIRYGGLGKMILDNNQFQFGMNGTGTQGLDGFLAANSANGNGFFSRGNSYYTQTGLALAPYSGNAFPYVTSDGDHIRSNAFGQFTTPFTVYPVPPVGPSVGTSLSLNSGPCNWTIPNVSNPFEQAGLCSIPVGGSVTIPYSTAGSADEWGEMNLNVFAQLYCDFTTFISHDLSNGESHLITYKALVGQACSETQNNPGTINVYNDSSTKQLTIQNYSSFASPTAMYVTTRIGRH